MLKLTIVADEGDLVRVQCEGEISQVKFQLNDNPLEALLGSGVYKRKLLMDLGRLESFDSSNMSWLVVSHKRFQQNGGCLVLHSIPPCVLEVLGYCRGPRFNLAEDLAGARALAECR